MKTFMHYIDTRRLNEADAPPGGPPPGGPPPGGAGGAPPPMPAPGGGAPPPPPMGGGMGAPPGGAPGAPGGGQASKKLKAYSVWDTLEKLVKGKGEKPEGKSEAPPQPETNAEPPKTAQG